MDPLLQKITKKIIKEGPITFETFMEMALYDPGLGYYASDRIEIGKTGDFYTSQHVHPVFGIMIARQLEEMWTIMEKPSIFFTVEPGAGEGYMCKDILDFLDKRNLLKYFTYIIVEPSPFLRQRQKKLLEHFTDKVEWVSSLEEIDNISGCILSNELLDSFPVHLIEMEDELKEIFVTIENDFLTEIKGYLSDNTLSDYLNEFSVTLPKGYRTEINLRIKKWLDSLNEILSEGFVITIDYGYPAWDYYSEERNRGTLLCYHKHQINENPYQNIGQQDITSHVNFSSVKKWGEELGFKTIGYCQQGTYLVALGIDEIITDLINQKSEYLFEIAKIKRLILPGTFGETHKVMIQFKGQSNPVLKGFSIKNQKDKL